MKEILYIIAIFILSSCASTKKIQYVPTEAKTIIEYRDSIIHITDTIKVQLPVEVIKEVIPITDTLRLETSVAKAEAYVDTTNNVLRGKIENKNTSLKAKVDTIVKVEYVDKIVEKTVIQEVPVDVPYIPKFAWGCIIFTCCFVVGKIGKLLLKIKGL